MPSIQSNVDLRPYNTFGLSVKSDHFTEIGSVEEFQQLRQSDTYRNNRRLILGGGSNVLFRGDFHGLVIRNNLKGIEKTTEDNEYVYLRAAAGENWHGLVLKTIDMGLGGLENLSLIPGCVGASPMQNIGAYGVEIKEVFEELEAFDMESGERRIFKSKDCEFGYRESIFKRSLKDKYLITAVTYRLRKQPVLNTSYGAINAELLAMNVEHPNIRNISEAVIRIRQSKLPDPSETGNAGSFFKNPEISATQYYDLLKHHSGLVGYPLENGNYKLAAGWLIEQCGLKGYVHKGAAVHERQALVLVNKQNCKGEDVFELSELVRDKVREKFGVELEREVNVIG